MDEFAGVYKCFKEAVFDYLSTARTVESLYSVVFYYTDRRILESYNDRKTRKQHGGYAVTEHLAIPFKMPEYLNWLKK